MSGEHLCPLDAIPDEGSAGFVVEIGAKRLGVLAVRRGEEVFVYRNECPHIGAPLDFRPGRFLNVEKTHIQCATHGALFRIEDGFCVSGPCSGEALTAIPVVVRDSAVWLERRGG